MKLQPFNANLGLWVNPEWRQNTPGAFAIVIGVSQYEHLKGTTETLRLESLKVSALTAYRFFQWLGTDYHVEGCEIAKCFLLLAPTTEELEIEPDMAKHALTPDWHNCELAIRWWYDFMSLQRRTAAKASRGMFFFSGHGIEKNINLQLLLPSDYWEPPKPNPNRAISTNNIAYGLATLKVPVQIFFIDGCRNTPKQLRDATIVGTPILVETANTAGDITEAINPDFVAPILLATSTGESAYQPNVADMGLSLFGSALLDGLAGRPNIELVQVPTAAQVKIYPLQTFTEDRVIRQKARQRVRLTGQIRNAIVTELPPQPEQQEGADGSLPGPPPATERSAAAALDALQRGPTAVESMSRQALKEHATLDLSRSIWSRNEDRTHEAFGSENASHIWMRDLRLVALSTGTTVDNPDAIVIHRVVHNDPPSCWEVELSVAHDDPIGHWLELRDATGEYWSTLLTKLDYQRATYRASFALGASENFGGRPLVNLESTLTEGQRGATALVALVWRASHYGGPATALDVIGALHDDPAGHLRRAPLAAIYAGLLATRFGDLPLAGGLIQMISESPALLHPDQVNAPVLLRLASDWAALMALWLVRQELPEGISHSGTGLARVILAGGLPHTSEGLFAAQDALRRLAGSAGMSAGDRADVARALERLNTAAATLAGNGLFPTCANTRAEEAMELFFTPQSTAGSAVPPAPLAMDRAPYELDLQVKGLLYTGWDGKLLKPRAVKDDDEAMFETF